MAHLIAVLPWQVIGAKRVIELGGRAWPWSPKARSGMERSMVTGIAHRWYHGSTNILRALCVRLYLCVPRACPLAQNVVVARVWAGSFAR